MLLSVAEAQYVIECKCARDNIRQFFIFFVLSTNSSTLPALHTAVRIALSTVHQFHPSFYRPLAHPCTCALLFLTRSRRSNQKKSYEKSARTEHFRWKLSTIISALHRIPPRGRIALCVAVRNCTCCPNILQLCGGRPPRDSFSAGSHTCNHWRSGTRALATNQGDCY